MYYFIMLTLIVRKRLEITVSNECYCTLTNRSKSSFRSRDCYVIFVSGRLSPEELQQVVDSKERYTRRESFKDKGPMLNETRDLLERFYNPFNIKMAAMTGDTAFLYTS